MHYQEALKIAEKYLEQLKPSCHRIELGGSLRRKKNIIHDIEIVCVPFINLFTDEPIAEFINTVNQWQKIKGNPEGKLTQRMLPEGISLDLFICNPENWGAIFLIRTGDWEFSKYWVDTVVKRNGYKQEGGYLWKGETKIPLFEEQEYFDIMKVKFIEPELRNKSICNF
jgi:DNA polymerase/3'-5' exonuclease PolX